MEKVNIFKKEIKLFTVGERGLTFILNVLFYCTFFLFLCFVALAPYNLFVFLPYVYSFMLFMFGFILLVSWFLPLFKVSVVAEEV